MSSTAAGSGSYRTWLRPSVLPEILEPIRCHFSISHRVHDISVAHVVLEGPGVMPIVGELKARAVSQRVRMDWERQLCGLTNPSNRFQESGRRRGTAALSNKNVSRVHVLAAELTTRAFGGSPWSAMSFPPRTII